MSKKKNAKRDQKARTGRRGGGISRVTSAFGLRDQHVSNDVVNDLIRRVGPDAGKVKEALGDLAPQDAEKIGKRIEFWVNNYNQRRNPGGGTS
jgi:hypothetical protein